MKEQQAIERIKTALRNCIDSDHHAERAAYVAWSEMKAISAELAEKHGTSPKVFIDAQLDALQ